MANQRYAGEFRAQIEMRTDSTEDAMRWLMNKMSIAARLVDFSTNQEAYARADGRIEWQPISRSLAEGHARDRSHIWTRNDPDLIPDTTQREGRTRLKGTEPTHMIVDDPFAPTDDDKARDQLRGWFDNVVVPRQTAPPYTAADVHPSSPNDALFRESTAIDHRAQGRAEGLELAAKIAESKNQPKLAKKYRELIRHL